MELTENVLEIRDLVKDFPGVRAVNNVSFDIKRNTVHCLVGENGAGKSTLIKILTGAYTRTSGRILLNGEEYSPHNPREARQKGISTLFQELNVVDQLTVAENLTLGMEDMTFGFLRKTDKINKMVSVMNSIEPSIHPRQPVSTLSVAKKQIVEIAKAVATESDIIIMDEPTAAISESEIERLFAIIQRLREQNVTVIYISHRLDEIFEIGDYVTVLRDGRHIDTKPMSEVKDRAELIKMMIGKTVFEQYTPKEDASQDVVLQVRNLSNHKLKDISFDVHAGEIVGFYGLVGAGKTELARAIYGADPYTGQILFKGKKLQAAPDKAIAAGIALVPEERRSQGLFTILTIRGNVPVMNMEKISRRGFINSSAERNVTVEYIDKLKIATDSTEKEASKLSGGNQQKVVLSKCLFADADLLMLDEPTRGIDVGAKSEIYGIIRQLSKEGKSIMIFSSELPEIMNICDTIYLLFDGSLKAAMQNGADVDSEKIIHIVTGGQGV
ncbi:MAG: sugar ABC transporter ATP-binding protein [Anaerolineae bacterium]|nr:sugar ABC transporter ATP-binding protein [Anaerolineales bacterium]MCQ3977536.1 sugar ABC transporter ATP-binding protein [Anaerolineae bacterium]